MIKFKNSIKYLILLNLIISVVYTAIIVCLIHKSGHLPFWQSSRLVLSTTLMVFFTLAQSIFCVTLMRFQGISMFLRSVGTACMTSVSIAAMALVYWCLETNTEQAVFPGPINFNELISTFGCCDIRDCHDVPKEPKVCCMPMTIESKTYRRSCLGNFDNAGQWCPSGCISRQTKQPIMNRLGITGFSFILAVIECVMAIAMAISPCFSTQLHTVI